MQIWKYLWAIAFKHFHFCQGNARDMRWYERLTPGCKGPWETAWHSHQGGNDLRIYFWLGRNWSIHSRSSICISTMYLSVSRRVRIWWWSREPSPMVSCTYDLMGNAKTEAIWVQWKHLIWTWGWGVENEGLLISVTSKPKSEGKERQEEWSCRDLVCVISRKHEIVGHILGTRNNLGPVADHVKKWSYLSSRLVETITKAIVFIW